MPHRRQTADEFLAELNLLAKIKAVKVFWATTAAGILVGSVVFGVVEGGVLGAIFGPIYAVVPTAVAVGFVYAIAAAIDVPMSRAAAFAAGAVAGSLATIHNWEAFFSHDYHPAILLAGVIGGLGGLAGGALARRRAVRRLGAELLGRGGPWRVSLRRLLGATALLAVALWLFTLLSLPVMTDRETRGTSTWAEMMAA